MPSKGLAHRSPAGSDTRSRKSPAAGGLPSIPSSPWRQPTSSWSLGRSPTWGNDKSGDIATCLRRISESAISLADVHSTLTDILDRQGRLVPAAETPCAHADKATRFVSAETVATQPSKFDSVGTIPEETSMLNEGRLRDLSRSEAVQKADSKSWKWLDDVTNGTNHIVDSIVLDSVEPSKASNSKDQGVRFVVSRDVSNPSNVSSPSNLSKTQSLGACMSNMSKSSTTQSSKPVGYQFIQKRGNQEKSFGGEDIRQFNNRDIVFTRTLRGWLVVPIIHPEAKVRLFWMLIGFVFIVYEAYAIPVYLAFEVNAADSDALFAFVSIVNSYFLCDIVMSFCTGHLDNHGNTVMDPGTIAWRYLHGWFICDIVSGIPWEWVSSDTSASRLTRSLRFIRAFRLLRLTRLLRLIKLKNVVDKVETYIEASQIFTFAIGIIRILLLLFAVTHWVACVWFVIGTAGEDYEVSWVSAAGLDKNRGYECYIHSLYYSLTTMTTVGYGDITPKNQREVTFALFILLVSSIAFAGLMGTLMDLISELNKQKHVLAEKKMQLSRYMHWRIVPRKLMMAIRTHLLFLWDTNEGYDEYERILKEDLPSVLKMELCYHIYGRVLSAAPFFSWMKDYPPCVKHIANTVQCLFVERGDHLFRLGQANTQIYMLISGAVFLSRNQMLFEDDVLGGARLNRVDSPDGGVAVPRRKEQTIADMTLKMLNKSKFFEKKVKENQRRSQMNMVASAFANERSFNNSEEDANRPGGLYVSDVMRDAERKMQVQDDKRFAAATKVQRRFRAKLKARRKARKKAALAAGGVPLAEDDPAPDKGTAMARMLSKRVEAPAYFGESCLWIPFDDWDDVPPPMYMYSARCESRGELILINRFSIQELIHKFGPWLAERFEYFREAVVAGYVIGTDDDCAAASGGTSCRPALPIPIDWAVADLEIPMKETVPMEAFDHMNALHQAASPFCSVRAQPNSKVNARSEAVRADAQEGLKGAFRPINPLDGNGLAKECSHPPAPTSPSRSPRACVPQN